MSNEKSNKSSQGVTISKRALAIGLIVVLLLVAGGVTLGLNWNRWFAPTPQQEQTFNPDIDPNAGDWKGNELPDKTGGDAVGIKIPGYPSITLPANRKNVTVALLNPEGNPCYFTFELVLKDTDEVLYTSKMVPPGQVISDITLSRALPAGKYNAVIRISTASLEDGSAMNGANVETVLIVQ
ncbi:MAG: hypothetical protein ACI4I3_02055 [Acutalibacteraceae bacterium]